MKFTYTITKELLGAFLSIGKLEERLNELPLSPQLRTSLYQAAKVRTSHFSNKIEGNCLTLEQTEDVSKNKRIDAPRRDIQEVKNVFDLFDYLIEESGRTQSIASQTILNIHRYVERNIVKGKLLGHFREAQNAIFEAESNRIVYLPPEAKDIPSLVDDFINQLNETEWEHDLIKAAIAHFGIVTLHPFMDGNGRTARALSTFILMQERFQFVRLMGWDEYFYQNRADYYGILHRAQGDNFYERNNVWNVQGWLTFFIGGVEQTIEYFLEHVQGMPSTTFLNRRQEKALRFLKRKGMITNREYRQLNKVSNYTALSDLTGLQEQGYILQIGAGRSAHYILKK